jgi:hypothetical protein
MSALETNGPIIANEMKDIAYAMGAPYIAIGLTYDRQNNVCRYHRTLKAAFRSLGSICNSSRGKLNRRDIFAAAIVTPSGSVMNWTEAKAVIRS